MVLRTTNEQPSLWEAILPEEVLGLPTELARVDELLEDPAFFAPFAAHFDPVMGRPSIPIETYLRMMFLKHRYDLGYETLRREVADSISWQRFCRIPFGGRVPNPSTLMKLTTRCGAATVEQLNETLLATAVERKVLRTHRLRADTTVVEADVEYPTDSGLLAKAVGRIARQARGCRPPAARGARACVTGAGRRAARSARSRPTSSAARVRPKTRCAASPASSPVSPTPPRARPPRWCATPVAALTAPARQPRASSGGRWRIWRPRWHAPSRSYAKPAPVWPAPPPTARRGWSHWTMPMPAPSPRADWANP